MKSGRTRLETAAINRQERLPLPLWLRHSGAICKATFLASVFLSLFLPPLALTQSPVTLRLMDWADLDEMPLDRQAVAVFERQHTGIHVLFEPNPGQQHEEKILTGLAANEHPDFFRRKPLREGYSLGMLWALSLITMRLQLKVMGNQTEY